MTTQPTHTQTSQIPNPVPALIRTAFNAASQRAYGQADRAAAAIAALRKLRHVLLDQAGTNAALTVVDGPATGFIMERNMRALANTGIAPVPMPLPPALALAGPAASLMLDAVENGLILHRFLPGNTALMQMVPELMGCLCDALDGTPDAGRLLDILREGMDEDEPRIAVEGPVSQRLH
ncbi:hypothetical protein [Niveispirillum lacus]|nr:hypothetical protein [Niveispirillum lacus]